MLQKAMKEVKKYMKTYKIMSKQTLYIKQTKYKQSHLTFTFHQVPTPPPHPSKLPLSFHLIKIHAVSDKDKVNLYTSTYCAFQSHAQETENMKTCFKKCHCGQ